MARHEFTELTQLEALRRQGNRCGSCGEKISALGRPGQVDHKYGEIAHAHHMKHCQHGGTNDPSNCVVLCYSCHYSVHNGGAFRNKSRYLIGYASDYPFFEKKKN